MDKITLVGANEVHKSHNNLYLLEEGRVFAQVFGNHVETEKVAIDALSCHCQAVHVLVLLCCLFEQLETLFCLNGQERD